MEFDEERTELDEERNRGKMSLMGEKVDFGGSLDLSFGNGRFEFWKWNRYSIFEESFSLGI